MSDATEATELTPNAPPATPPTTTRKRQLLAFMFLQMALWPLIAAYHSDSVAITYLLHLAFGLSVYFWCRYDAAAVGKKIPWLIAAALIVIPQIAYAIYMVRVRRAPMGEAISLTFLWTLLFIGTCFAAAYVYYDLWYYLTEP